LILHSKCNPYISARHRPKQQGKMRKRTVKLWRLNEDGRKVFAGTLEAGSPAEHVAKSF
jgi:hypothetical protein